MVEPGRPGLGSAMCCARAARDGLPPARAWSLAAEAASAGADATAGMRPRLGRASYLGERAFGVPDGGAAAVSIWLGTVARR
ncbi:DAK2 domain-containing protein [Bosea sp. (in: a-proteobacteria)]|uniref:DAK2 domain-containing protein n=1 Tax=Bosea sp. (in: a-proteobacteria) TaxID=1871050 RepID=UPI002618DBB4|nr:DAK2 domain-containing protein [Bosea sp. (in: a-proteobacteria)]